MGFYNKYPYTDFHEMNLDWLLAKMRELEIEFDEFKVVNNITFSGQWDITKNYPAWTIVNDNNIGYVSIQPVPVGVVLTNTDYWVEVIDYSAQIAGMQNRIVALENEDIVINGKINTINDNIDNIEAKEIILLGDSYGVDATVGTSWATIVETNLSDSTIYRSTVGGTSFASDMYITDNNLSMLQALELTIPDPDKVKDIIILGGANDANLLLDGTITQTLLETRITSFMQYAKTHFKNAIVKVAFVAWRKMNTPTAYINCRDYYEDMCNKFVNSKYYKAGETIMHNQSNFLDTLHPIQSASDMFGLFACSMITDSDFTYSANYQNDSITMDGTYSLLGDMYTNVIYEGDYVELNVIGNQSGGFVNISNSVYPTVSSGVATYFNICTIPNMVRGYNRNVGYCVATDTLVGTSGGTKHCRLLITYLDNKLSIKMFNIDGAADGTQIYNLLIPPFTIRFPIRLN